MYRLLDSGSTSNAAAVPAETPAESSKESNAASGEESKADEEKPTGSRSPAPPPPQPVPTKTVNVTGEGTADAPMEISDSEGPETKPLPVIPQEQLHAHYSAQHQPTYPGGFAIDVCFEASKLPLDVAIFNSARAAGGDEKIRKYLQAVLVIGGTALVPGMAHALESR